MAKKKSLITNDDRIRHVERLAETELSFVAEQLGANLVGTGGRTKMLCPFHADHDPSLAFYLPSGKKNWRYKCFACGASGDVFDLVKEIRKCTFREAVEWLSGITGITPPVHSKPQVSEARSGADSLEVAAAAYQRMSKQELTELDTWAKARQFDRTLLVKKEVFFASPDKLSSEFAGDRETLDFLEVSGLIVRRPKGKSTDPATLPIELPPVDFFWNERIIFVLRDDRNRVVAIAGRATRPNDEPKYLFSRGFKKRDFLYGLGGLSASVESFSARSGHSFRLFIVEGLTDVLRLQSLGQNAVAVLGSEIGLGQVELLSAFAKQYTELGSSLVLQVYLDADPPGRMGAIRSVKRLLKAVTRDAMFRIEMIYAESVEGRSSKDPDEQLLQLDQDSAEQLISKWRFPVPTVLMAAALECSPEHVDKIWNLASSSERGVALRKVDQHLSTDEWKSVFDSLGDDFFSLEDSSHGAASTLLEWQIRLKSYLLRSRDKESPPLGVTDSDSETQRLLRAIQLAQSSTQRKEAPTDELSWQRILTGVHVVLPYLISRIHFRCPPLEPYLAVRIPKSSGGMRLKALPCPEDLACQQYLLNSLLLSHALDAPEFHEIVPAVRYSAEVGVTTSGPDSLRPDRVPGGQKVASFAYQVDMDVLCGVTEPRGDGLFRPYIECWSSFIDHISQSVIKATLNADTHQTFFVSRLDVRSYYDMLPRFAVNDVLRPSLEKAASRLSDPKFFVPLFAPHLGSIPDRTNAFIDHICNQCFGYTYYDPSNGTVQQSPFGADKGIPQGPDLSAYLATISLFPLDRRIVEEVACSPAAIAYGRYVDDMVLVATTAEELERLRGIVQFELRKIGLELSPKTEPLPRMSGNGVLNWLTEKRGGLGVSGIEFGPPISLPALSDDGGVDRREALVALGELDLYRESTDVDSLRELLHTVRSCPDLRFNDKCRIAALVWRLVASDLDRKTSALGTIQSGERFAEFFKLEWSQTFDEANSIDRSRLKEEEVLTVLFGLEQFLCSRRFLAPDFSDLEKRAIHRWRMNVAMAVHSGLLTHLRAALPNTLETQEAILNVAIANLHVIASQVTLPETLTSEISGVTSISNAVPAALARSLISLAAAQKSSAKLDILLTQPNTYGHLLMHEAMVRLACPWPAGAADPLQSMTLRLGEVRPAVDETEELFIRRLRWWLPDDGNRSSLNLGPNEEGDLDCKGMLEGLLNIGHANAARLLQRRTRLVRKSLNSQVGEVCDWLPVVPVECVPGFVGFQQEHSVLRSLFCDHATDLNRMEKISFLPSEIEFESVPQTSIQKAQFDSARRLETIWSPEMVFTTPGITQWIAHAFESLVKQSRMIPGMECPPFLGNMVGPSPDQPLDTPIKVVGFLLDENKIRGQAFIREPDSGLIPHGINKSGDYLWRAGYAIANLLGLADRSTNLPSVTFDSPYFSSRLNNNSPRQEDRWAIETLLRFSLFRLCGKVPTRVTTVSANSPIPPSIKRVLNRLEQFPTDTPTTSGARKIGLVLSAVVETRFAAVRAEARSLLDASKRGVPCAVLAHLVPHRLPSDVTLSEILPGTDPVGFMPKRRATRAWYLLSLRLAKLSEQIVVESGQEPDQALKATLAGLRLVSLEVQLRAQVLELIAINGSSSSAKMSTIAGEFRVDEWGLDGTELLHEMDDNSVDQSNSDRVRNDSGVLFLWRAVELATNSENGRGWQRLNQVTPLGWVVLLGICLRSLRVLPNPSVCLSPEKLNEINEFLARLALDLAVASSASSQNEQPWGDLSGAIELWTDVLTSNVLSTLDEIDAATEVEVTTDESPFFAFQSAAKRSNADGDGGMDVTLSNGRRFLQKWQIISASGTGERSTDGVERFMDNQNRYIMRWSQSFHRGRLVAIHYVQPRLARLSGILLSEPQTTIAVENERSQSENALAVRPGLAEQDPDSPNANVSGAGENNAEKQVSVSFDAASELGHSVEVQDFRRTQESEWRARSDRAQCYLRVAMVQWHVEDMGSYAHPVFEVDRKELQKIGKEMSDGKGTLRPEEWSRELARRYRKLPSSVEYRRHQILREVFRACRTFKVDCLLLPEYSTRPDTVEWIRETLLEMGLETIVWAGTFRYPPFPTKGCFSWLDNVPAWAAVAPVVVPRGERFFGGRESVIRQRMKKYPSVAYNEMFATDSTEIPRLIPDGPELASRVIELICSEIFLATSPSNLLTLAISLNDLRAKFGGSRWSYEDAMDYVLMDVKNFAYATSLARHPKERRSVLFVPAMTPRAQDYVVLGQANYLASGMTTVFCNDSSRHGHGQSCFIGHNGWENEKDGAFPGIPMPGPYSGVLPGIFRPRLQHPGWLEQSEQAMVIADIDPTYQMEGRPRPQNLLPPLQLVAHLPIMEAGNGQRRDLLKPKIESSLKIVKNPRIRAILESLSRGDASDRPAVLQNAVLMCAQVLAEVKTKRVSSIADDSPTVVADCLRLLAAAAPENEHWLHRRADAYENEHAANPQSSIPATLIDWLHVNVAMPHRCPEICVPAYNNR
ncbi:MAG: hypothetical protein JNM43_20465 [Planctomycetaceae bacterium]|nr:hypothetical protein [Planctomycetaceae bacterium]